MPDNPQNGGRAMREDFLTLPGGMRVRYAIIDPPGGEPRFTTLTVPGLGEPIAKKDFELGDMLAAQGARHIVFDLRGQGLSDRFLAGDKRQRAYIPGFGVYVEDLDAIFAQVVTPNQVGKLIVGGHSTGGLALLSWLARNPPHDIAAAIVTSPAVELTIPPQRFLGMQIPVPLTVALLIAGSYVAAGKGSDYAWGEHDFARRFEDLRLTHDRARFDWLGNYFAQHPEQITGGATWGWLFAMFKRGLRIGGELARIRIPVLTILAGDDPIVPSAKIEPSLRQIPNGEIVTIKGALHEIMNEGEPYRSEAIAAFGAFIRKHAV